MSSIGSTNIGIMNTVGSLAAAQRNDAGSDRSKVESSQERFQSDQEAAVDDNDLDVAEANLDADRDADGRQSHWIEIVDSDDEQKRTIKNTDRAPDAFDERGTTLDLEA